MGKVHTPLPKKSDVARTSATEAPGSSTKRDSLRGASFAEGDRALAPDAPGATDRRKGEAEGAPTHTADQPAEAACAAIRPAVRSLGKVQEKLKEGGTAWVDQLCAALDATRSALALAFDPKVMGAKAGPPDPKLEGRGAGSQDAWTNLGTWLGALSDSFGYAVDLVKDHMDKHQEQRDGYNGKIGPPYYQLRWAFEAMVPGANKELLKKLGDSRFKASLDSLQTVG
ncbi:MAG: hypothetical protein IT385_29125 [Deltaproteobacteria bacterium]|nr:hypothetical protein [Deltaproteobacteria bacterium]